MKHESSGTSSDLSRARELSRRLAGAPGTPPARPSSGLFAGCVKLPRRERSAEPPAAAREAQAAQQPVTLLSPSSVLELTESGGRGWDSLLGWLRDGSGCQAAFVMDSGGLLIASSEGFEPALAEPVGARLLGALGHCKAMTPAGDAPVLAAALGEWQVTVFEVRTANGLDLLIGLVAAQPVPASICRSIAAALGAGPSARTP